MRLKFLLVCLFAVWGNAHQLQAEDDKTPLWMRYPALSPDGKQVVFSYKGDLFKVSSEGGDAVPLTVHEAHDYKPVWSPDGRFIAFASIRFGNYDVFVMPAEGGKATRLTYFSGGDYPTGFSADGKRVFFTSTRNLDAMSDYSPEAGFPSLFSVSIEGGAPKPELGAPIQEADIHPDGKQIVYQDRKGYEDVWRKHHTSSVTRDIWLYDGTNFKQLSTFEGENRAPQWTKDGSEIYFLSEKGGTFNVWKMKPESPDAAEQITKHEVHPVRFPTLADDGTLCYGFNGEIYIKKAGSESQRLKVNIPVDEKYNEYANVSLNNISEFAAAPNGKEVAFISRGEIFVTATESGITRRITDTPEQERSVSFSPDGRKLLYASEREGSWNIYETKLSRESEKYFHLATAFAEKSLVKTEEETFRPAYSPDGKEVAFLASRTSVKVLNLESKKVRTVTEKNANYSYSDGDQWFEWSPDGKFIAVEFLENTRWRSEVGIVNASNGEKIKNITKSGYNDAIPRWSNDGTVLYYFSDRMGLRSHGSWGSTGDVFAYFLTQEAWDKFKLSKGEFDILYGKGDNMMKKGEGEKKDDDKEKGKEEKDKVKPVKIEFEELEDRHVRLTMHSSSLNDFMLSHDNEKLYYLTRFEKGYDLWVSEIRKRNTKIQTKLGGYYGGMQSDKDGKYIFIGSNSGIMRIDLASGKQKPIGFNAVMKHRPDAERAYLFEHMWRQVDRKFYVKDIHGVAWDKMKEDYARFLPHINNNRDFAEMMSELLGELNGSHTGCRFYHRDSQGDRTATLGAFYDLDFKGAGLKIKEIMPKSPLLRTEREIKAGQIITHIDGIEITPTSNYFELLNRKAGQRTLLHIKDGEESFEAVVKPLSWWQRSGLLYKRWIAQRRAKTEKLSGGRLGYVHVRGMDSPSFREVYSEALGRYAGKDALVVDTRFNGGGWLHDDLATLLSGKVYFTMKPRGQVIGNEPEDKWNKPSIVIMSEGNYSDAHIFPYVYKELGIGKLVGMPVAGTGTAVWWEMQITGDLVFGIPQVGLVDTDGDYLENKQLEPDVKVPSAPEKVLKGEDPQLQKAVEELMKELD